jgi:hypothetical protein
MGNALLFFQAVGAFWTIFIQAVEIVEKAVPDDAPGTAKFDLWLKTILSLNGEIKKYEAVLPQVATFAKDAYNLAKSLKK